MPEPRLVQRQQRGHAHLDTHRGITWDGQPTVPAAGHGRATGSCSKQPIDIPGAYTRIQWGGA